MDAVGAGRAARDRGAGRSGHRGDGVHQGRGRRGDAPAPALPSDREPCPATGPPPLRPSGAGGNEDAHQPADPPSRPGALPRPDRFDPARFERGRAQGAAAGSTTCPSARGARVHRPGARAARNGRPSPTWWRGGSGSSRSARARRACRPLRPGRRCRCACASRRADRQSRASETRSARTRVTDRSNGLRLSRLRRTAEASALAARSPAE